MARLEFAKKVRAAHFFAVATRICDSCCEQPLAVEKLEMSEIIARIGMGNWSGDLYKFFIVHPDAMLFWPFSRI
jgi:hypothetical protein